MVLEWLFSPFRGTYLINTLMCRYYGTYLLNLIKYNSNHKSNASHSCIRFLPTYKQINTGTYLGTNNSNYSGKVSELKNNLYCYKNMNNKN